MSGDAASGPAADPERAAPVPERGERAWVAAAAALALLALVVRLDQTTVYPAVNDFDAPGHLLNAYSLREGRLSPPTSWLGFHPPLYHALSALAWRALPASIPVHVQMRMLSALAGFAAVFAVWRILRRRLPRADAAVACAVVIGAPVFGISTTMLGNETTCALFATLALGTLFAPPAAASGTGRLLAGGLAGAAAALTKSTGLVAVAAIGATWALRLWRTPRRLALVLALAVGLPVALATPFYGRIALAGGGSPMSLVTAAALSPDLALIMSRQPPGERSWRHYVSLPSSTFFLPRFDQPGMLESVPGMLYASIWADGHGDFVLLNDRAVRWVPLLTFGGLLPTLLVAAGLVAIVRRRRLEEWAAVGFGAALLASLLRYSWILPHYSAVKASYLLPAMLPAALALGLGIGAAPGWLRGVLRALLLLLALAGTVFTMVGWWAW